MPETWAIIVSMCFGLTSAQDHGRHSNRFVCRHRRGPGSAGKVRRSGRWLDWFFFIHL